MRKGRKRQKLVTEINALNLVLSTFTLPDKARIKFQRRRLRCIEKLARLESVQGELKPSVADYDHRIFKRRKSG